MRRYLSLLFFWMIAVAVRAQSPQQDRHELHRPQIHFSPLQHWMNDPNGMVYENGTYHLFYQYYPGGNTWGPMHWGHAISTDMIHWKDQPIALYPDSLGYIFSGSAVVDTKNTSGLGRPGKAPLVAIFTHHDAKGEKAHTNNFQNQSLAYSLDHGKTWTKYKGNPVLKNPGITDFRDPKVSWYAPKHEWLMTLATKDRITFYSSPNLKQWKKESEFGAASGAHGGVWECPDLFPMKLDGKTYWILIVNINPGGPNKGSATQYFMGDFDGTKFTAMDDKTRWLDYGPDEYAGVTWNNTGNRHLFLGWMSNWLYGEKVPTEKWRSAMTIPRELKLVKQNGELLLTSEPVKEINTIVAKSVIKLDVTRLDKTLSGQYEISLKTTDLKDFTLIFSNDKGEALTVGFDAKSNRYFIDRSKSGIVNFNKDFPEVAYAPRFSTAKSSDIRMVLDDASIELFADGGMSVMTAIFFPAQNYNRVQLVSSQGIVLNHFEIKQLSTIWH